MVTTQEAIGKTFPKGISEEFNIASSVIMDFMVTRSDLKDSGVVLHEIVRCNYTKLLPTYQSSHFNTQVKNFQWLEGCVVF